MGNKNRQKKRTMDRRLRLVSELLISLSLNDRLPTVTPNCPRLFSAELPLLSVEQALCLAPNTRWLVTTASGRQQELLLHELVFVGLSLCGDPDLDRFFRTAPNNDNLVVTLREEELAKRDNLLAGLTHLGMVVEAPIQRCA